MNTFQLARRQLSSAAHRQFTAKRQVTPAVSRRLRRAPLRNVPRSSSESRPSRLWHPVAWLCPLPATDVGVGTAAHASARPLGLSPQKSTIAPATLQYAGEQIRLWSVAQATDARENVAPHDD